MLTKNEPYREPAAASLTEKQTVTALKRPVKKLRRLSCEVELKPLNSMSQLAVAVQPQPIF